MRRLERLDQVEALRVLVKDGVLVVVVEQVVHLVENAFADQKFAARCADDFEVFVARAVRFERDGKVSRLSFRVAEDKVAILAVLVEQSVGLHATYVAIVPRLVGKHADARWPSNEHKVAVAAASVAVGVDDDGLNAAGRYHARDALAVEDLYPGLVKVEALVVVLDELEYLVDGHG